MKIVKPFSFLRQPDSCLVINETIVAGRVKLDSVDLVIAGPDSVKMHWNVSYDLERSQSLNISTDKSVASLKGPPNIPDKLVIAYGNDMGFEYTSLDGEGAIRKDESSSNYYYNFHIKDHLGSTRMVITDASNINEAIMYQPLCC